MDISVVVVNYRQPALLGDCLASIGDALTASGTEAEVVVVDNGSGDDSAERARAALAGVRVIELPENLGFAAAVGLAVDATAGEWVLCLNNDATIDRDGITRLLETGRNDPAIGSVAALMLFASSPDRINSAGIEIDRLGVSYDRRLGEPAHTAGTQPAEVFGACAGAALYRREMLDDVGGFDRSFFLYLEDADLAWRARMRDWRAVLEPRARVLHQHGATAGYASPLQTYHAGLNRVRMLAKNATTSQLLRSAPSIALYDVSYVAYAACVDRTLAPLRGRLRGLGQWRAYRDRGRATRGPIDLPASGGVRAALARRRRAGRGSGD